MTTNYERIKSYQECPTKFKQWLETETENEKAKSRI